jgi:hypothetical protein
MGCDLIAANVASGVSMPAFRLIVPEDHDAPKYLESDTLRAALIDHEGATVMSLTRTDSAGADIPASMALTSSAN